MLDSKCKYSITIKTSQQTQTIKSTLKPNLSQYDFNKTSLIWFRHPPPPYQVEQLSFNCNQTLYKCSSLDYECSIVCKVYDQGGNEVNRFDFGPIQTFVYNRLSTSLQLRVQVLLFGSLKKCLLTFTPAPTLINPQNNNKYQLTQQDIRSIYVKPQPLQPPHTSSSKPTDHTSFPNNQLKKTIIIENLFQRLILLKLFHEIPNGMYCHSVQVLEVSFYDESSCSMALLALNRFKYQKRQLSEFSKSMFTPNQQLVMSKLMKRSNDSLSSLGIKNNVDINSLHPNLSDQSLKKEFLPLSAFKNWKKSPKQSINSGQQSIVSGNSSKINESRISTKQHRLQFNKTPQPCENKESLKNFPQPHSRLSLKQPKISVPSTDINSTKQPRQQKVSFPEAPTVQTLKSSQLIIKPNEFKLCLSLRRSQQQIKTPRMDVDEQANAKNYGNCLSKRKSTSVIQQPNENCQDNEDQNKYVNQFQNLLFQVDAEDNKEQELCLNDSFAKMQEQEEKQNVCQKETQDNKNVQPNSQSEATTIQQRNLLSLQETLRNALQQNSELKQRNQELRKELSQGSLMQGKKDDISKYQDEIQKMKQVQFRLIRQIEELKLSSISSKIYQEETLVKVQNRHSPEKTIASKLTHHQTEEKGLNKYSDFRPEFLTMKKTDQPQYKGICSQPRQSKNAADLAYKQVEPISPTFGGRRSQDHNNCSFMVRQFEGNSSNESNVNIQNSGEQKFLKFQNDPDYQKFRNNQSYSYKPTQFIRPYQQKGDKQLYNKC